VSVSPVSAAEEAASKTTPAAADPEADPAHARVEVDGTELFRVRSLSGSPAEQRAAAIVARIEAVARDPAVRADALRAVESDIGTEIMAGKMRLMIVTDAEARLERADRRLLADAYLTQIRAAIAAYREARTRDALTRSGISAAVATAVLAAVLAVVIRSSRRLNAALERRYRRRVQSLGIQSFEILRAERIWTVIRRMLDAARVIVLLVFAFLYLEYVLGLLPWTRGTANRMLQYVADPLWVIGRGIAGELPDVVFLVILFFVTRYLLKLVHLLFGAVGRGQVVFAGFEPEWAEPTYKLLRVGVIVLALVVAYPYIPGSESDAFKGISIFVGIVLSLGSSSAIANMIAGYLMTYRRAFRVGDRVKIGDTVGDVVEMRLQVTHLRTIKNEEVIVPNSTILNNEVMNYSSLARKEGLILHTTVGIGYEVPWRQVEAMLLAAAERTRGLMTEPPPFVRQESLGDFAITYELNVYCDNAQAMNALYTELHRNILDVFNEFGVQIMTPAYEGDPAKPKVVPKERWFAVPAEIPRGPTAVDGHQG
jgi:small-conductance mechanosensitive channel